MTPAAPTATWRRVCEDYFSRLIEDLEQEVESEVESRVTAAVEAAVRGAVADAATESRRTLEELNQGVRRLRQASDIDDLNSVLLDVTTAFCEQAVVFSIQEKSARAERMRRPAQTNPGEASASLPPLTFPISEAAAFSTVIDTRDPVVALSTPAEVSAQLVRLFGHEPDERVYLFPLASGGRVTGVFYAGLRVQAPPLEMLCEVAGLRLHALMHIPVVVDAAASVPGTVAAPVLPKLPDQLVGIYGSSSPRPAAGMPTRAAGNDHSQQHQEWWDLSRQEQQLHLAAQRFARVQVAEMRLAAAAAFRKGRAGRDIYGALKQPIEDARQQFREKHMTVSPTMVDYLHLEMVRSLADDDANILGPNYPGPLV